MHAGCRLPGSYHASPALQRYKHLRTWRLKKTLQKAPVRILIMSFKKSLRFLSILKGMSLCINLQSCHVCFNVQASSCSLLAFVFEDCFTTNFNIVTHAHLRNDLNYLNCLQVLFDAINPHNQHRRNPIVIAISLKFAMAPISDSSSLAGGWEPGTVIELIALILTAPGAVVALITLWVIRTQLRSSIRGQSSHTIYALHTNVHLTGYFQNLPTCLPVLYNRSRLVRHQAQSDADAQAVGWFREHYLELHGEIASERQQWAEEPLRLRADTGEFMTAFPPHR
jgi:hypothetical protein